MVMISGHELQTTPAERKALALRLAAYFAEAQRRGVTHRVAAKALETAASQPDPIRSAWEALAERAKGRREA